MTIDKKKELLFKYATNKNYTDEFEDEIVETGKFYDLVTFKVEGKEYAVGDYDEAYKSAKESIKDLFDDVGFDGFNAYSGHYVNETKFQEFLDEINGSKEEYDSDINNYEEYIEIYGEDEAKQILVRLEMVDVDTLVKDVIENDGLGHALAYYDGYENSEGDLLIYRIN